jgi:Fungal specific transcription factor domain
MEPDGSSPESSQELIVRTKSSSSSFSPLSSSDDTDEEVSSSWTLVRSPSPPVISTAGGLSLTDLRLFHHWSTSTFSTLLVTNFPDTNDVLQRQAPSLAFQNEFLMHGLLGTASLHMQHLFPDSEQFQKRTYVYRAKAFSSFRQSLNCVVPNSDSYDAALLMSVLLVVLCSQDYLTGENDIVTIHWIALYGGLCAIIDMKYPPGVSDTSISPILRRKLSEVEMTPVVPTVLLNMMRLVGPTDPDYSGLQSYCSLLDQLGILYASLCQDGLGPDLFLRIITFCTCPSEEFIIYARERRPRALVILSYYLSFLKLVTGVWWVEGIADKDIETIARTIDPKWLALMKIPLQVNKLTDRQEIAKLLLS